MTEEMVTAANRLMTLKENVGLALQRLKVATTANGFSSETMS